MEYGNKLYYQRLHIFWFLKREEEREDWAGRGQTTDTLGEEGKGEDAQQTFNGESKQGVQ